MAVWTDGPVAERQGPSLGTLIHYTGVAASFGIVIAVAIWGYQLVVRDVTGVPVIRAMAGAMRVAPETPGGDIALNEGLSVNAVAAEGEAASPADVLVLAPPQPDLTQEDLEIQPMAEAGEMQGPPFDVTTVSAAPVAADPAEPASIEDLVNQIVANVAEEPVAPVASGPVLPAVLHLRPQPRPTSTAPSSPAPVASDVLPQLATGPITPGTVMVQLGAFPSVELAQTEWTRLQGPVGVYLAGKAPLVQEAEASNGTFYRLRASGFADQAEARGFCAVLSNAGVDCIPAVAR